MRGHVGEPCVGRRVGKDVAVSLDLNILHKNYSNITKNYTTIYPMYLYTSFPGINIL